MTPAANPSIRVGGMAFGNGVLMRGPHYWAWAAEGRDVAYAPVRTLLSRHPLLRLPLIRSLVSFAEMFALMFTLHRRNGLRRSARFAAVIAVVLVVDLALSLVIPFLVRDLLLANIIVAVGVFAAGVAAMRLGLGKKVWRYH